MNKFTMHYNFDDNNMWKYAEFNGQFIWVLNESIKYSYKAYIDYRTSMKIHQEEIYE